MGGNSRTTFAKRQKSVRQEKQADKAQRRVQRKLENQDKITPGKPGNVVITYDEEGHPEGLGFHDF